MDRHLAMDRNLALEFVRITEYAALASARFTGRGDSHGADEAAVTAMREAFQTLDLKGRIVIGEGERDQAPMLYIGEEVGQGSSGIEVDIALDPLEGTSICAHGGVGALSVIAVGHKDHFLHAPDVYMDKIAVSEKGRDAVSLDKTPKENLKCLSEALSKPVEHLTVVILNRPRHKTLIEEVRKTGARIHLIEDGDVSAAIATQWESSGVDMLLGVGGAPEGVITAAALKCMGGHFEGRLQFSDESQKARAKEMGVKDPEALFLRDDLVKGDVMFCATGVTDGSFLKGVKTLANHRAQTHSVVMRSSTETIRYITAEHNLKKKPLFKK